MSALLLLLGPARVLDAIFYAWADRKNVKICQGNLVPRKPTRRKTTELTLMTVLSPIT
jgi:hypothetical protein